jgi:hypothetical protein
MDLAQVTAAAVAAAVISTVDLQQRLLAEHLMAMMAEQQ